MEKQVVAQYVREFSEIEDLQRAACVRYTLCRQQRGLCLSVGPVSCGLAGLTEEFAGRLLLFLYENSVAPENLCGVVRDICGELAARPAHG